MHRLKPWLLAAGAGLAFALALPGAGWWPLLLVVPGLLLASFGEAPRVRRALLLGWLAGTVQWCVATNWVIPVMHHYGGLPAPLAVLALIGMSAILAVTWAAAAAVTALVPPAWRPALFPAAFTAVEALRQYEPFRFPWGPPAAAVAHLPALLGSLPVWGAAGLGWALLTLGGGGWALLRPATRRAGVLTAGTAALLWLGATAAAPPPRPSGEALSLAALQPGTSLEEKWDPAQWQEVAARVWALTEEAAAAGADVVLWPESAVPFNLERDPTYRASVEELARRLDVTILLNSIGFTADGEPTNAAYAVTTEGVAATRYDKTRLVPFGEYVPAFARFLFPDALVREVGAFSPGESLEPLPAGVVRAGMAICYEVVFPGVAAGEVRRGAELLVTLTNDGWYGYSWAPHQHFAQAVLRAVETRRPLARAALTGISGFVDPRGRVTARLPVGDTGLLVHEVAPHGGLTPAARWGDWWPLVAAAAALALVGVGRRNARPAGRG